VRYNVIGAGLRIILLILLVLVLVIGGLLWFDYLEIIDGKRLLGPVLRMVGLEKPVELEAEDPYLLEKERLAMQLESLELRSEELDGREERIAQTEAEQQQIREELADKERDLEEREKSFNERQKVFENRKVSLEVTAGYLVGMPPEEAVDIMLEYEDDMELIDIIATVDRLAEEAGQVSISSYWLSLMPAATAQRLIRKMNKGIVQ
jgi:flagellar protein FlbB